MQLGVAIGRCYGATKQGTAECWDARSHALVFTRPVPRPRASTQLRRHVATREQGILRHTLVDVSLYGLTF